MKTIIIAPGNNVFDVAVTEFGTLEALFDIASLNGLGVTAELAPGAAVMVDESLRFDKKAVTISDAVVVEQDFTLQGQSLFDLAVQFSGSMEGLFDFAQLNKLPLTADLVPGTPVNLPKPVDKNMRAIIKALGIKPATAVSTSQGGEITPEGIGYWAIGVDFMVN